MRHRQVEGPAMSDDLKAVMVRVAAMRRQVDTCAGEVDGMRAGIEALSRLDKDNSNPRVAKQIIGLTRDAALKMLEMGQAMRRIADLTEPLIDDALAEEGGA